MLRSALFRYSDTESELASVMAHEISRHPAPPRAGNGRPKAQRPADLGRCASSILLAMASPQAGMAAFTGTLAGTQQGMISFTRQNEEEADRIGIQVLQRSGFDPQAMPAFWETARPVALLYPSAGNAADSPPAGKPSRLTPATAQTRCVLWLSASADFTAKAGPWEWLTRGK